MQNSTPYGQNANLMISLAGGNLDISTTGF